MIISTKKGTPQVELDRIVDNFEKQGLSVTLIRGTDYNVFGLVGDTTKIAEKDVLANPWVENVTRVSAPYKRANRLFHPEDTVVDINGVRVGGNAPIAVMAGPCSIEGEEHTIKMAKAVKAGGANFLRGGAAGGQRVAQIYLHLCALGTDGDLLHLVRRCDPPFGEQPPQGQLRQQRRGTYHPEGGLLVYINSGGVLCRYGGLGAVRQAQAGKGRLCAKAVGDLQRGRAAFFHKVTLYYKCHAVL